VSCSQRVISMSMFNQGIFQSRAHGRVWDKPCLFSTCCHCSSNVPWCLQVLELAYDSSARTLQSCDVTSSLMRSRLISLPCSPAAVCVIAMLCSGTELTSIYQLLLYACESH
jgi:hypothetical protein